MVALAGAQGTAETRLLLQAELGGGLVHCPPALLLPQDVDKATLPDNLTFLYNHLAPLLLSPSRHTQVAAAHLLAAVAAGVVEVESEGGLGDESEERALPG